MLFAAIRAFQLDEARPSLELMVNDVRKTIERVADEYEKTKARAGDCRIDDPEPEEFLDLELVSILHDMDALYLKITARMQGQKVYKPFIAFEDDSSS
jgi:hypothetical protein